MIAGSEVISTGRTFVNEVLEKAYGDVGLRGFGESSYDNAVIGTGIIRGGYLEVVLNRDAIRNPNICGQFCESLSRKTNLHRDHIHVVLRPEMSARKGVSAGTKVGHSRLVSHDSYGTLGTFIVDGHNGQKLFMISNNHVFAATNKGKVDDPIYWSGIRPIKIGRLQNYVTIYLNVPNKLDLAVATYDLDEETGFGRSPILAKIRPAVLGEPVMKVGATTGRTEGIIHSLDYSLRVDYDGEKVFFQNQLKIVGKNSIYFSQGGDSGSAIYSTVDDAFVGLLFAGAGNFTAANHGIEVVAQLKEWGYIR